MQRLGPDVTDVLSFNDPFTLFLIAVAGVLLAGYGLGRWVNRRRAQIISAWLEPGLRALGGHPVARPLNRSAFRFKVTQARSPYATLSVSVVLLSREVLPVWLLERLRRRQDVLFWHIKWRQPPKVEAEVIDANNELGRRGESVARQLGWMPGNPSGTWHVYGPSAAAMARAQAMAQLLTEQGVTFWRLAVRKEEPHLLLSMPLPEPRRTSSGQLVAALGRLSKLALDAVPEAESL